MIEPCRKEDDTTTTNTTATNQPGPETVNSYSKQQQDEEYFERRIEFEAPEVLKLFPNFKGNEEPPELKILQKWDSDESGVVWDASLLLAKYLERLAASKEADSKKHLFSEAKAVELGSGTGFLGLWLAAMGARVLLTDLPSNLELMKRNLKLNSSSAQKDGIIEEDLVSIAAFDWLDGSQRQTERDFLGWAPIGDIDYFIVSDCLYYKEGIEAIYSFLDWVLGDLQTSAQFLIAYEDREDKAEMITQFLIVISHNPALKCTEIPATELHPDYHSPDLHLLLIVARKEK
ncbi:hypothetical protein TYRP_020200 [Tyrophagus putrescentiae]|nr:hypothetical protein TYRP_020200 [Tyrophagus putrescentiae]